MPLDTTAQAHQAPRGDGWTALAFRRPAAGGGRVLSADHAPQTPQAPSEDVSAATPTKAHIAANAMKAKPTAKHSAASNATSPAASGTSFSRPRPS